MTTSPASGARCSRVPERRATSSTSSTTSAILYLSGVAAAIGFRMNLFNIGVEGQYRVAAFAAARLRRPGLAARLRSTPWSRSSSRCWSAPPGPAIAGVLRATRGVSEVISTIMLNAIAGSLIGYFITQVGRAAPATRPAPRRSPRAAGSAASRCSPTAPNELYGLARCSRSSSASASGVLLNRTRFGFDLRATGRLGDRRGRQRRRRTPDDRGLDAALRRRRRADRPAGAVRRHLQLRLVVPDRASASPASRSRCSAATTRSASPSAR